MYGFFLHETVFCLCTAFPLRGLYFRLFPPLLRYCVVRFVLFGGFNNILFVCNVRHSHPFFLSFISFLCLFVYENNSFFLIPRYTLLYYSFSMNLKVDEFNHFFLVRFALSTSP